MPYFYKAKFSNPLAESLVGRLVSEPSLNPTCNEILLNPDSNKNFNCAAILLTEKQTIDTTIQTVVCPEMPWTDGDVVRLDPHSGRVSLLYSKNSNANALFVTERCNCNCIMCPQPPKQEEHDRLHEILELIACLPNDIKELGITGGEPTILGDNFIKILEKLKEHAPDCCVHVLSNARLFSNLKFAQTVKSIGLRNLSFGIPIYSSDPTTHDYIVQAKGAYDQTLNGIYNLAECRIPVEIRVVIHKQTYRNLRDLSEFIYFSLPFVFHIAFMGMEHMGYVKKNWGDLWINPLDYQAELFDSVNYLNMRGMNVSIYNLPLCYLTKELWPLARKSISDYKDVYLESCTTCSQLNDCGGLFKSQANTYTVRPFA